MDLRNRFESRTTFQLLRAEYAVALAVSIVLFLLNIDQVNWLLAITLFVYIDLIGYLPGAIAYRRSATRRISRIYYVLYNTMHSLVTQAAVVGVLVLLWGWNWAMLSVVIHLAGDRALFGNFLKSFRVPFEPEVLPEFSEFDERTAEAPARSAATGPTATTAWTGGTS